MQLSPLEVMNVLFNVGKSVSAKLVCSHQPLQVEHNRTFLVDLQSLKSHEHVKCDDIGSWENQSYNRFLFTKDENEWAISNQNQADKRSTAETVTLKREYYSLKDDDGNCDFRRRIDSVTSKCTSPIFFIIIKHYIQDITFSLYCYH